MRLSLSFLFKFIVYSSQRPYSCTYEGCDKAFKRNDHLTRHKRCHEDIRDCVCEACGSAFRTPYHLKRHHLIHEKDTNSGQSCPHCNEPLPSIKELQMHKFQAHNICDFACSFGKYSPFFLVKASHYFANDRRLPREIHNKKRSKKARKNSQYVSRCIIL